MRVSHRWVLLAVRLPILDTDTTPTLEGEHWLMHHGYTQAEGVTHLDQVAEAVCLVTIGFPKFKEGAGRLCPLRRHLSLGLAARRCRRRRPRSTSAQE